MAFSTNLRRKAILEERRRKKYALLNKPKHCYLHDSTNLLCKEEEFSDSSQKNITYCERDAEKKFNKSYCFDPDFNFDLVRREMKDIKLLRRKLHFDDRIPERVNDHQLAQFLNRRRSHFGGARPGGHNKLSVAYEDTVSYFEARLFSPDIFNKRYFFDRSIYEAWEFLSMSEMVSKRGGANNLIFIRLKKGRRGDFHLAKILKISSMGLETIALYQTKPYTVIIDSESADDRFADEKNFTIYYRFISYLQNALPIKVEHIYLVNVTVPIFLLNWVMRQVMSVTALNMVEFVFQDWNSVPAGFNGIANDLLPSEYGGSNGPLHIHESKFLERIKGARKWFQEEECIRQEGLGKEIMFNDFGFLGKHGVYEC